MSNTDLNLKTKEELLNSVKDFYNKEVLSILPEYEKKRKEDKYTINLLIMWILGFILSCFCPYLIVILFAISILLFRRNGITINGSYEMNIKKSLMPKFLNLFGNFKWYRFSARLMETIKRFRALKIFPDSLMIMLDDTIMGSYKNVGINIYEIRTGVYANALILALFIIPLSFPIIFAVLFVFILITGLFFSSIPTTVGFYLIIFTILFILIIESIIVYKACLKQSLKGVIIEYTFPKSFNNETFIYENGISSQKLINKYQKNYEKISLEDLTFNDNYRVFSNNQVEARYLLTTAFMERFKEIEVAFKPEFHRAEFKNNKLYILIKTKKDLFKFGSLSEETTFKNFKEPCEELYSIISLINHFKLDQKIGL